MDIADALAQMAEKHRYREARAHHACTHTHTCHVITHMPSPGQVLFMADTCQAATLPKHFYAPGVVAIGSSKLGEPSWSYLPDSQVGLSGAPLNADVAAVARWPASACCAVLRIRN